MSLLTPLHEDRKTAALEDPIYNAGYVYGPAGGITDSELQDIREGDYDRETGRKRCVFCRQPRPLKTGNGTTCDDYCEANEYSGVPVGRPYPQTSRDLPGREWLTLG